MGKFSINIASEITENRGRTFGPFYTHFAKVELGDIGEQEALARFATFKAAFPEPAFKLQLTVWTCTGRRVAE